MLSAVWPVTAIVAPVDEASPGLAARMAATSASVAALCGPLAGITWRIAVVPAGLNVAGVTTTTSGSLPMAAAAAVAAAC